MMYITSEFIRELIKPAPPRPPAGLQNLGDPLGGAGSFNSPINSGNNNICFLTTAFLWYNNSSESACFKERFGGRGRMTMG